ncbi:AraC family transcriptional regulator [Photobacterium profundum]|uniref:helix-turn-helix domain-containing protein n=1 Tax=Photobacterium profundum TaxID=74109 RepID=UPI003D111023
MIEKSDCKETENNAIFNTLQNNSATLHNQLWLPNGSGAAIWSNENGQANYCKPDHHTLSFYLDGGEKTHRLCNRAKPLYGAPNKLCLMPAEHQSQWRFSSRFKFLHLYFGHNHLQSTFEKAFDKEGRNIELMDQTFVDDSYLSNIFHHTLLPLNWHDRSDTLAFTHIQQIVYVHLLKNHCNVQFNMPNITGGLSPIVAKRINEYIHDHLASKITIEQLANIAELSEFHFSRMFHQSFGSPPHQYVLKLRTQLAAMLLKTTQHPLADIAIQCGFSSQPHFTLHFKTFFSITPAKYRQLQR